MFSSLFAQSFESCLVVEQNRLMNERELEAQFHSQLYVSGIACGSDRTESTATVQSIRTGRKRSIHETEVHMVGDVKRFGTELQIAAFFDLPILDHRQINLNDAGITNIG